MTITAIDPFIQQVPKKLVDDAELRDFYTALNKTLNDLTTIRGNAIASPMLTNATDNETALQTTINSILTQLRLNDIKT